MTSVVVWGARTFAFPDQRGVQVPGGGMAQGIRRLATDPIGFPSLSMAGLAIGTEITVRRVLNNEILAHVENTAADPEVVQVAYFGGAASNVWLTAVKPGFRTIHFQYQVPPNDAPVQFDQQIDRAYSNP